MCASLPALRLFLRTVPPNLMSSGAGSRTTSGAGRLSTGRNTRGLQTIGSTGSRVNPKRNHYGRFDDEEAYQMETIVTVGKRSQSLERKKRIEIKGQDHSNESREWNEDGTSETGIIQTKTMEVRFTENK